ncbi:hypothetical protein J3R30DRAFT_3684930 [Lentinula aciculospora]|uniref:Uncharacterized protein n=1 Tax=Lentinula aciculospora TaxID=153920 RepID=A0A9W9A364_9AGAR|nr:hypothetical protein J3R30DRAFT_3684930 [Lentinula aciculospora]
MTPFPQQNLTELVSSALQLKRKKPPVFSKHSEEIAPQYAMVHSRSALIAIIVVGAVHPTLAHPVKGPEAASTVPNYGPPDSPSALASPVSHKFVERRHNADDSSNHTRGEDAPSGSKNQPSISSAPKEILIRTSQGSNVPNLDRPSRAHLPVQVCPVSKAISTFLAVLDLILSLEMLRIRSYLNLMHTPAVIPSMLGSPGLSETEELLWNRGPHTVRSTYHEELD